MGIDLNIKNILSDALDSIKGSIISMGKNKIGKVLLDGVRAGVVANGKYSSKLADMAIKEIDARHKMGLISEQEYYKKLEEIRDRYLYKGCVDWWKYTAQIGEYENQVLAENANAVAKAYSEMADSANENIEAFVDEAEDAFERILEEKEEFSKKLSDYGGLYSKGTVTIKNAGPGMQLIDGSWIDQKDIVFDYVKFADFEKQVKVLESYRDALFAIKERGNVPTELFDVLRSLSVEEGLDVAEAMLKMSDVDFEKYISGYIRKKQLEKEIANDFFEDEVDAAKAYYEKSAQTLIEELEKSFENVPESFLDGGIDAAKAFGEGFMQNIDSIMDAIKMEVTDKLSEIAAKVSVEYDKPQANVYNSSYNFYGSGQSVSQQLEQARIADTVNRLRGN